MNFKIYKKLVVLSLLVATSISCSEEYLEVTPKGSLIAQSVEDYELLLEDPSLNDIPNVTVPLGDEIAAVEPYFSTAEQRTRRLYKWEADIYNSDQNSQELEPLMASLYVYNKVINEVNDAVGGTALEKQKLEAEARIGRAFNYFILINYYGKPYNSSTSSTDLGFPIIRDSDISSTNFTRNTVEEVYDFIIDDIEKALPFLSESVSRRNRASRAAAEGLLGKVFMFQQKFDLALDHLELALSYVENSEVDVALYDYNVEFLDGGVFTPVSPFFGPAGPSPRVDKEIIYIKSIFNPWAFIKNEFVINTETANLYKNSDLRLNFYSDAVAFGSTPYYPNSMLRKLGPLSQQVGVFLPDVYLLMIEAKARLGYLEDATTDLENFRAKRMPVNEASIPTDIATNQHNLVKFIFEERIREFALGGYRWFDMRRLSVDPKYNDLVDYTHNVYNEEGDIVDTYTLTTERFVLRFGGVVTSQNPDLIDNP